MGMIEKALICALSDINTYIKQREHLANTMKASMEGKIFHYDMKIGYDTTGFCIINDIIYDRMTDGFIVILKDIDTGCVSMIHRCHIHLKEVYTENNLDLHIKESA